MLNAEQLVRRSRAARASLWGVALVDAAAMVAGLLYIQYLRSLPPTAPVAELELVPSESAYGLVGLAQGAVLIVAAVLFIRWFHLAYSNLSRIGPAPPARSPAWTIWGFFVPILNLFRPYQLMREIWTTSSRVWRTEAHRVVGLSQPRDDVNLWWALFLATSFVGNAVARAYWRAETAQETLWAGWAMLGADAFDAVAAVVAAVLVRSVTELQRPLLDHAPQGPAA